ncbi:DExH-box ATP-dependent RNA helicase DExH1 [Pseudoscourfieldia marina]
MRGAPRGGGGRRGGRTKGGRGGRRDDRRDDEDDNDDERDVAGDDAMQRQRQQQQQQRWWDPAWRAQKLEEVKQSRDTVDPQAVDDAVRRLVDSKQEEVVLSELNLGRRGAEAFAKLTRERYPHLDARRYGTGQTAVVVISTVALPDYRADVDVRSTQRREVGALSSDARRVLARAVSAANELASVKDDSQGGDDVMAKETYGWWDDDDTFAERATANEADDIQRRLEEWRANTKDGQGMQARRALLPAHKSRDELIEAVHASRAVVISGQTGCGKTTQVPQFLLEDNSVVGGEIIVTQPRRLSAMAVSARVAEERGEALGQTVGYRVRLSSKTSRKTRLTFCTTGVLLKRMESDPHLRGVSYVVVDEIHERGMLEDFLLVMLRDIVAEDGAGTCQARVLLMSATLDADHFANYFGDGTKHMHIPGRTFPVSASFLDDLVASNAIVPSRLPAPSTSKASRHAYSKEDDSALSTPRVSDIDVYEEAHGVALGSRVAYEMRRWSEVAESATDVELVVAAIEHVHRTAPLDEHRGAEAALGAVLVFLPGWDSIAKVMDACRDRMPPSETLILPLHASLDTREQNRVFKRSAPGVRKIILSTNVAETSITIDDILYVIDSGKSKQTGFDLINQLATLDETWISQANAVQRRGRAGRVQAGLCVHLFPRCLYDRMQPKPLPEMSRAPLAGLVLQIKALGLGEARGFLSRALDPPDDRLVGEAVSRLKAMDALQADEELTPLGRLLCDVPADPAVAKVLIFGALLGNLDDALIVAAGLSRRSPFALPSDPRLRQAADAAKRRFAGRRMVSDHAAMIGAYLAWEREHNEGGASAARQLCRDEFLSYGALVEMRRLKEQLLEALYDSGVLGTANRRGDRSWPEDRRSALRSALQRHSRRCGSAPLLSAVLAAGLFPNVAAMRQRGRRAKIRTREDGDVDLHPGSVVAQAMYRDPSTRSLGGDWLVYGEKVRTTSVNLRDVSVIPSVALVLFGGAAVPSAGGGGFGGSESWTMLDGWASFDVAHSSEMRSLRTSIDMVFQHKFEDPSWDMEEATGRIADAVEALLDEARQ